MSDLTPEQRTALIKLICAGKKFFFDQPADEKEASDLLDLFINFSKKIDD